jgi:hypothetical protein
MGSIYNYVDQVITTPTFGEQAMSTTQNTQANHIPYTTLDVRFTVNTICIIHIASSGAFSFVQFRIHHVQASFASNTLTLAPWKIHK